MHSEVEKITRQQRIQRRGRPNHHAERHTIRLKRHKRNGSRCTIRRSPTKTIDQTRNTTRKNGRSTNVSTRSSTMDTCNVIMHYKKHPTLMRPYFGNANYYNPQHMAYPSRMKRKMTYKDYMYQLRKIAMEDVAPEVANFGESVQQLSKILLQGLRNFPNGNEHEVNILPGPAPLLSNIPRAMAAEGDNELHWLMPWSIWRTMRIMPLLSKLMTRGPELQWETYNPTPTEARALVQSATLRIPRYRLGENIPWNKKIYHMYNNRHRRYGLDELKQMTQKWITRNTIPTKAVAKEKAHWSSYLQALSDFAFKVPEETLYKDEIQSKQEVPY